MATTGLPSKEDPLESLASEGLGGRWEWVRKVPDGGRSKNSWEKKKNRKSPNIRKEKSYDRNRAKRYACARRTEHPG